ncbi:MAG: toll/interleukin-1 receptor domain-containing protein [Planctomycetota bacterium]
MSHSAKDAEQARKVCSALEGADIPCWIAPRDIGVGDYGESIISAIENAAIVLVLLSSHANDSVHVKNEAERASSKRKPIITFRLENVAPARSLELFLSSQHWVNGWTSPWRMQMQKLIEMIREYELRSAQSPGAELQSKTERTFAEITRLLHSRHWLGYDPTQYNPNPDSAHWPTEESIYNDLGHIHAAKFTGVITFGCKNSLSLIPSLAKERGLAVIAGVWNPADEKECQSALAQSEHVDAYCVGHNNLGKTYQRDTLDHTVSWLRNQSQRPVTTSEEIRIYRGDDDLCTMGDWLFPDCHVSLRPHPGAAAIADVERAIKGYSALAHEITTIAKQYRRPLMLKMVTFPWAGIVGASLERQAEFFAVFLEALRDPEFGLSGRVALMYNSAFDVPWKNGHPFYPWDVHTGLLELDGSPRPAVSQIISRVDLTI